MTDMLLEKEIYEWKEKLKTILFTSNFCGICLKENSGIYNINSTVNIAQIGIKFVITYGELVSTLCREEKQNVFASEFLCEDCALMAIKATIFIMNIKKTKKILDACLQSVQENFDSSLLTTNNNFQGYDNLLICLNLKTYIQIENNIEAKNYIKNMADSKIEFYENNSQHKVLFTKNETLKNLIDFKRFFLESKRNENIFRKNVEKNDELYIKCKQCKVTVKQEDYVKHMKKHTKLPWHCPDCNKLFYDFTNLKTHLVTTHNNYSEDSIYSCNLCRNPYFSKTEHKCKYFCPECEEMPCPHEDFLLSYRDQKEGGQKTVQCPTCAFTCSTKPGFIYHVNFNHLHTNIQTDPQKSKHFLKFVSCEFCNGLFKTKHILEKHISECHEENGYYSCEHCEEIFDSKVILADHIQKSHAYIEFVSNNGEESDMNDSNTTFTIKIENDYCLNEVSNNIRHLKPRRISKHTKKVSKCNICGKWFVKNSTMVRHKREMHNVIEIIRPYRCQYCTSSFKTEDRLARHVKKHRNDKIIVKKVKELSRNSKHSQKVSKCYICDNWFSSISVMNRHMKNMHKDVEFKVQKPFKDSLEDKSKLPDKFGEESIESAMNFDDVNAPSKYLNEMKQNKLKCDENRKSTKKYACEECSFETIARNGMQAHINRVHRKERPYICDICSKAFYSKMTLTEHVSNHYNRFEVQCEICGAKLGNLSTLRIHVRRHTGEMPYACDLCGKSFITTSRMQEHKLRHHTQPNIPCPICKRLFLNIRFLRDHFKKVHLKLKANADMTQIDISKEYMYIFKDHRLK